MNLNNTLIYIMKKILITSFISLITSVAAVTASDMQGVPRPIDDLNGVVDNTPDSIDHARMARPVAGSSRVGDNPVLFLVGNSTMRTGTWGDGRDGMWGWGYFMPDQFDRSRITVENHALGGMSSRTFYNKLWADVVKGIRPGDWVIIELGHNDNGPYDSGRARASIPGIGNDTLEVVIKETGVKETVLTFGGYMCRMIADVKSRGGNPILLSLTPRNAWDDADSTIVSRVKDTFGLWSAQVAEAEGIPFIDLNDISARKYEKFGKEKVKNEMFYKDRIHTTEWGARVNAESAAEGIRAYPGLALADYLLPEVASERPTRDPITFLVGNTDRKIKGKHPVKVVVPGVTERAFIENGQWDKIYRMLAPGDVVVVNFADVPEASVDDETHPGGMLADDSGEHSRIVKYKTPKRYRVVYPRRWYRAKIARDTAEKGASLAD